MQRVNRLQARWHLIFCLIAVLVIAADQLSKAWIRSNLAIGASLFDIGFFRLIHAQNTGAAFGLFYGQSFLLTVISIIGAVLILLFAFLVHRCFPSLDSRLIRVALGLILGGTIGNLIDRLQYGSVTDFLDFNYWPAFNAADSSVTVGVIIFACSLLFLSKTKKEA